MSDRKPRLVITGDDLPQTAPAPPAPAVAGGPSLAAAHAGALPPVTGVRPAALHVPVAAASGGGALLRGTLVASVLGALLATLVGWVPFEVVISDDGESRQLVLRAAIDFGLFGAVFGAVYSAWDDASSGVWSRVPAAAAIGLGIGLAVGALSGAIAQALYGSIVESILADAEDVDDLLDAYGSLEFYVARGLGWGVFGLGVGAAAAAAKRSARKLVNGLIGGAAGGLLGGLVFHWLSMQIDSGPIGRHLGLVALGLGIGAAIGLVEVARRQAWLRVLAGGMAGKEFIVYHEVTDVGSSPRCQITLIKDPAVAPHHLRIVERGARRTLQAFDGCHVVVNGVPVTQHVLRSGDVVHVGSTALQFTERAIA